MAFFDVPGASLHYEVAGHGPSLVLVHGGFCHSGDWQHQVPDLARDHTVVTLDLRAHGQSTGTGADFTIAQSARDVAALVEALAVAPAVLVGHSLASRIVAEVAYTRPDVVAGLVLIDGSRSHGGFAATGPGSKDAAQPMLASLDEIVALTVGPHADAAIHSHVAGSMTTASPALSAAAVATLEDWDRNRADTVFAGLRRDLPVLAIQSTYHDAFTPRRSLCEIGESTPYLDFLQGVRHDLQIIVLPETGHFSMMERPGEVNRAIRTFSRATTGETRWPESD